MHIFNIKLKKINLNFIFLISKLIDSMFDKIIQNFVD